MQVFGRPTTGDLIAGVSVALVAIPQSLAYAELAGMPAQYGLFASALPSLLAAFFVSSRYLQTGPVALTALLTYGALTPLATEMSAEYIQLAALLALLVGIMRVLLGLARLGKVAYLLTPPVLIGFTTAAAILIMSSQLPKVFGVDPDAGGVLRNAVEALVHPAEWRWSAMAYAAAALTVIFAGRRLHRLFPGVLLAVVGALIVSRMTDYGGDVVSGLDGGFVSLGLDFDWSSTAQLLVPAAAIALVGFAEPSSIARTFATFDREPWNADREMVSQGVANLASAVSGAFPVGGSFSRSSLNRLAGARTAWAGAITGAIVLLALPATPVLEQLPEAVLGAIVIGAVLNLINLRGLWQLRHRSRAHVVVGLGTLAATLATAPRVERGVIVGVVLSIVVGRVSGIEMSDEPSDPAPEPAEEPGSH